MNGSVGEYILAYDFELVESEYMQRAGMSTVLHIAVRVTC